MKTNLLSGIHSFIQRVFNRFETNFSEVVFILSILWLTANTDAFWMPNKTQHFCDVYNDNDRKLIVYSDTNDFLFIIDDKYWHLKEGNRELSIVEEDRTPNASPLLSNKYSFAVEVTVEVNKSEEIESTLRTAFYNVINRSFSFQYYY